MSCQGVIVIDNEAAAVRIRNIKSKRAQAIYFYNKSPCRVTTWIARNISKFPLSMTHIFVQYVMIER